MFASHTTNLPPEQRQRVHADFLANEETYLSLRDSLLRTHRGQWVAIHNGKVIAADASLLKVSEAVTAENGHPYIARVGEEDQTVFRVRHASFAYDSNYQPFALPRVTVTFSNDIASHAQTFADVIPDTGADLSVLPHADCAVIDLFNSPYLTGLTSGVLGGGGPALIYRGHAEIDGNRYTALIQPVAGGNERIVGRDVLNQLRVLFDGPSRQVTVDP